MRVLVLGGDGYLGWPTAMHFSARGHEVAVVDNELRRRWHAERGTDSLTPILRLPERVRAWREVSGREITAHLVDICDAEALERVLRDFEPEAIIHYGEQPSAPYSMIDREHAVRTQVNNVIGTLNVLWTMRDVVPDAHLTKLGCYDDQTEVLTRRGWLAFRNLKEDDEVCCLDATSEEIRYHQPTAICAYPYEGPMHRVRTKSIDWMVTPNHRVFYRRQVGEPIDVTRADELPDIHITVPGGGRWTRPDIETFVLPPITVRKQWGHLDLRPAREYLMDAWLAFFGLWLAEGCIRRRGGQPTEVRLAAKKPGTMIMIREALRGLGCTWSEHDPGDGCINFAIADVHLATYLERFGKAADKHIPEELKDCSARQLEILYHALIEGDGHVASTGTEYFFSISDRLLGDVQELALKIGKAATLCTYERGDRRERHLSIGRTVDNFVHKKRRSWVDYEGVVYCCTVPTGIIMVRRNGRAYWSGNTMGEYGTPNIDIEEGYIEIEHKGRRDVLPFPKQPGSFYHLSKVHDSHNIALACKIWGLRATDLNQGVVYGIHTAETELDERLLTRFDYDEAFGTALNRFCVQAVIGHPLTVYGVGHQTRGFLNIRDTLQCVELAALHPASSGEMRVFNQFTETFTVLELAEEVQRAGRHHGLDVEINHLANPRAEAEEHYYNPTHTKLLELGLEPRLLSEDLIESALETIERYRDRVIPDAIDPHVKWR